MAKPPLYINRHTMAMTELQIPDNKVYDASPRYPTKSNAIKLRKTLILMRLTCFAVPDTVRSTFDDPLEQYEDDAYDDIWDVRTENWKKGCKHCRSTSSHKKPRPSPSKTVKASVLRKELKHRGNLQANTIARKENTELRLQKRHLTRFGYDIYHKRTDCVDSGRRVSTLHSDTSHKGRQNTSEGHPGALLYVLKKDDITDDFSRLLVDLQHRDLTPEDYELLLRLDEKVAPKTVSESALSSFDTLTLASSSEMIGELCSICMEVYSESQCVKTLPCQHIFHCKCIDTWLSSASLNCPLDGIAVES